MKGAPYVKPPRDVCVIGLGKLGFPFAVCWASRGFRVHGVDIRPEIVEALSTGTNPYQEHGLDDLLLGSRTRIFGYIDGKEACLQSDTSFVVVPTPSKSDGTFSTRFVEEAYFPLVRPFEKRKHSIW